MSSDQTPHLWEIDHPYYGADGSYGDEQFESFQELRAAADGMDEDMNLIYRWDWKDYSTPEAAAQHYVDKDDEEWGKQELLVFFLMPRKGAFGSFRCPVTYEEEAEVREWLSGPRCAGHLRTLWEPINLGGAS